VAAKGEPVEVDDHSLFFTGPDVEQAIPYGIYDRTRNTGWVNVGVDTTPRWSRWSPSAAGGGHADATTPRPRHGC
jgi:DDE family transposase